MTSTKFRKYLLRAVAIIAAFIVLLMIGVFAYVSLNKQKIIREVTTEISKKINGNISVGNVELSFFRNFPQVSVLLHDVRITDTMFAQHKHAFLEAKEIFAQLSIRKLIKKQSPLNGIKVVHGAVYLYTDSTGYTNQYLFKQKKDSSAAVQKTAAKNELQSIELDDFRFTLDDQKKGKLHDFMIKNITVDLDDKDDKLLFFSVDANMLVHSLSFNSSRGSFLKEKKFSGNFNMSFDKQLKQLEFDSINVKIEDQRFNLSGRFELSGDAPQFSFRLHAKDILFSNVKAFVPDRIAKSLSIVNIDNPLNANAMINGPLKGGDPLILLTWDAKEVRVATPFLDFDEAAFTGYFTNEVVAGVPRKDPNSKIVINNFSAGWHGLPVHADNVEILDLSVPTVTCDLQSSFPLTTLSDLVGTNSLQLTSGNAVVDMTYKGPIEKNDNTNSFLNGSISFKDGTVLYAPRDVEMQHVNAVMLFKNSDVYIDSFQTVVLNNKFQMQGVAKNLLSLINTSPNNINIDWNIYSPALNLNAFNYLLKARKKVVKVTHKKAVVSNLAATIDSIIEQGKIHVQLKTNKLLYKKFEAQNVSANVSLLEDSYLINNVSMNHAGGTMSMNGSLVPQQHNNVAKLNVAMNNVDVSRVFKAFDNFGQDGITDQSLEGQLTGKVNASFLLNENGTVNPSSLASTVDFSLKNGALNNYEPVKKMQKFIFKKRDFENIRFAELKDRLDISNQEIKINRMEIQSSVLSMFVEGIYSMKGKTDISIQVPLNNLKKRDSTYNPENIGVDKKGGKSIYLRGQPGSDGNIKFSLDLFNKYNKAKKSKGEK